MSHDQYRLLTKAVITNGTHIPISILTLPRVPFLINLSIQSTAMIDGPHSGQRVVSVIMSQTSPEGEWSVWLISLKGKEILSICLYCLCSRYFIGIHNMLLQSFRVHFLKLPNHNTQRRIIKKSLCLSISMQHRAFQIQHRFPFGKALNI